MPKLHGVLLRDIFRTWSAPVRVGQVYPILGVVEISELLCILFWARLFRTKKSDQCVCLRQKVNTLTSDDAFPQVNQENVDAGLVQNSASVNATSPVGVTTTTAKEDVEIERESSLTIGELHNGSHDGR